MLLENNRIRLVVLLFCVAAFAEGDHPPKKQSGTAKKDAAPATLTDVSLLKSNLEGRIQYITNNLDLLRVSVTATNATNQLAFKSFEDSVRNHFAANETWSNSVQGAIGRLEKPTNGLDVRIEKLETMVRTNLILNSDSIRTSVYLSRADFTNWLTDATNGFTNLIHSSMPEEPDALVRPTKHADVVIDGIVTNDVVLEGIINHTRIVVYVIAALLLIFAGYSLWLLRNSGEQRTAALAREEVESQTRQEVQNSLSRINEMLFNDSNSISARMERLEAWAASTPHGVEGRLTELHATQKELRAEVEKVDKRLEMFAPFLPKSEISRGKVEGPTEEGGASHAVLATIGLEGSLEKGQSKALRDSGAASQLTSMRCDASARERIGLRFLEFCREGGPGYAESDLLETIRREFRDASVRRVFRSTSAQELYFSEQREGSALRLWVVSCRGESFLLPTPPNETRFETVQGFDVEGTVSPQNIAECLPSVVKLNGQRWEVVPGGTGRLSNRPSGMVDKGKGTQAADVTIAQPTDRAPRSRFGPASGE